MISAKDVQELHDKCRHLEEMRHKLTVDLDQTHAADREKARQMAFLQQQVAALRKDRDKVRTSLYVYITKTLF